MKKYIIRVQYTKDPDNFVWLIKAKNNKALENLMAKEHSESLSITDKNDNSYGIDGYEYEKINNRMFKKNDLNLVCGTWIGANVMRDTLKKLKEKLEK